MNQPPYTQEEMNNTPSSRSMITTTRSMIVPSSNMCGGNERFRSDLRQFGGILFGLSICATFFPLAGLVGLINSNGGTVTTGIPFSSLFGALCVLLIGITGTMTGYMCLVHDYGHQYLTGFLLVFIQTAFIGYMTDIVNIGKIAATGMGFIPAVYSPSRADNAFVGAMGILGVLCYGICFLGSLAFMAFSIYAYQVGKPGDRGAGYYRGRLAFYSGLLVIVGLAQLMLGAYILSNIGSGPLPNGAIGVAMFVVWFPEISVFVGLIYILNGIFGLARSFGMVFNPNDNTFQMTMAFQYLCTLVLMILTQIAWAPGGVDAAAAPSVACLTLGAHVLPAFLDYKARSTPEVLPSDYYGLIEKSTLHKQLEEDTKV